MSDKPPAAATAEGGDGTPAPEKRVRAVVPMHYPIDFDVLEEMIERRNMSVLQDTYGGVEGLATTLGSNIKNGPASDTVAKRREQFGINELNKKEPVTFIEFVIDAFKDRIVQILTGAAIISIIFGMTLPNPHSGHVEYDHGWIEGTAIIISVLVVTMTGSINNYTKAKKFEEMEKEQSVKDVSVFRDGKEQHLKSDEIVVGDLLVLETGMEMVCDGIYISGNELKTNEASITGEPDLIEKGLDKDAFIISGTSIEEGDGLILVIAVGMNSFQGKMKEAIDEESGETPLQEHLEALADMIGRFGLAGAIILVVALSIKEVILITTAGKFASAISFLNFILIAITLIAVAIPEGLPLAVTIALSFSMNAMMAENCMVRVLASCETMGAATAICSDKTGTLTTNRMTVVQGCVAEEEFLISGYGLRPRGIKTGGGGLGSSILGSSVISQHPHSVEDGSASQPAAATSSANVKEDQPAGLARAFSSNAAIGVVVPSVTITSREDFALCSTKATSVERIAFAISINSTAREQMIDGEMKWVGNKTEFGLLGWVKQLKKDYAAMRQSVERNCVRQFPFSSAKKRMTTFVKDNAGIVTAYSKGASEAILASCDRYLDREGNIADLTAHKRQEFEDIIADMANQGNRTIGVAYGNLDSSELPDEEIDVPLIFIAVIGIQDPIREEVPGAVLACQSAHLVVRMVTGDNINTAIAIAKKCHIYTDNGFDHAMTGIEFRNQFREDKEKLIEIIPRLRVLARSSPQDKYVLVDMLKECGEVVGVTGDGSNDAPALKLANVGFAMKTGTDIAKGAADMVLIDDNFATVVIAIKWGRAVNDNVRKFLQFQLAINVAGVMLTLVGSLASPTSKEPFTPVQLLWLNMIMDTLAAIALATERPEDACLAREPVYLQAPIVANRMRLFIAAHGAFQFIVVMIHLWLGHLWFHCVDGGNACNQNYPTILVNGTITDHPIRLACDYQCRYVGGQIAANHTCQQGKVHSTMIFNTFIFFQIFNIFNSRKIHGEINCFEGIIDRSRNLLLVFSVILLFQVFAVEVAGDFMSTTGLSWDHWLICVGIAFIELPYGFLLRLLPVTDFIPEVILDKAAREQRMRQEAEEEQRRRLEFRRQDPSLRRASFINKRRTSTK